MLLAQDEQSPGGGLLVVVLVLPEIVDSSVVEVEVSPMVVEEQGG